MVISIEGDSTSGAIGFKWFEYLLATLWTVALVPLSRMDCTGWFFFTVLESPTEEWGQEEENEEWKARDDEKENYHYHT
jgi:hypothetical protein